MNKFCPDLVGYEDVKSYAISSSWENARVPKLHPCIKDECAAYEKGYCHKWNTVIEPNKKSKYFNKSDQTLDFKHFKLYSENTLKNMNKDKLIEYIHMLYHNWALCDEICQNLMNNAGKLKMDNIKAYLDNCIRYWRSKRDKENCEYAIYYIDCFQSIRSSILGECLPVDEKKVKE